MTLLFRFFAESARWELRLDQARQEVLARQYAQTRLQTVFEGIDRSRQAPAFYTETSEEKEKSLRAVFNQGIDPDPAYSGSVEGKIFLDREGRLCLAMRPLVTEGGTEGEFLDDPKQKKRKEILFTGVREFSFEFLGKTKDFDPLKKEIAKPLNGELEWRSSWPKTARELPTMVRLTLRKKEKSEPVRFAFLLFAPGPIPTYATRGQT